MPWLPKSVLIGLAVLLAALRFAGPGAAADADAVAVQSVISQQMDAFKHDDAKGAYAFASPGIQRLFQDPDHFLGMVRSQYAPVYRPKSVAFGAFGTTDGKPSQTVSIIDGQGQAWTAVYTFEKQDGRWVITGCVLTKNPETSA